MKSQNSKEPAGCQRYKGAKLGVPGEDAARPHRERDALTRHFVGVKPSTKLTGKSNGAGRRPAVRKAKRDPSNALGMTANSYSEFRNAIRSDISSCVRFIWKRWL
jgi:hypothetical protein